MLYLQLQRREQITYSSYSEAYLTLHSGGYDTVLTRGNDAESTNRLLRIIIALLLRQEDNDPRTLRRQIEVLDDLGMKPGEIAGILARSGTYINKELSGIRRDRKKRR